MRFEPLGHVAFAACAKSSLSNKRSRRRWQGTWTWRPKVERESPGEASLLEFLDAQHAFNDAVQTFNEAKANYPPSLYLIDAVSGATVSGS